VAFMEGTAAWRWRERWLRLKRALERRPSAFDKD
jgi:hypothetical protein